MSSTTSPSEKSGGIVTVSKPEEMLALQLKAAKIAFERQFKPFEHRKFAFDFVCGWGGDFPPEAFYGGTSFAVLLVDVQGGVWIKGGHTTGTGVTRDCEKYSLAAVVGYRVILCTPAQIKKGLALQWITEALS